MLKIEIVLTLGLQRLIHPLLHTMLLPLFYLSLMRLGTLYEHFRTFIYGFIENRWKENEDSDPFNTLICIRVSNIYSGFQYIFGFPIYIRVSNMYSGFQYIFGFPICIRVSNIYSGFQYIFGFPIYIRVSNIYSGFQYIFGFPILTN